MNKIKIILITLVIIVVASFVLYGVRTSVQDQNIQVTELRVEDEITWVDAVYVSETGDEAQVKYYSDTSASLTLIGSEYKDIQFTHATSASGARYENSDLGLVLWEKSPDITIYKEDESIFSGRKFEVVTQEHVEKNLLSYPWVWIKTIDDIGPLAQESQIILPKKQNAFTLIFNSNKQVQGTTDCNNFSGTYSLEFNKIVFNSFMSTLMYCEGSQEQEFIQMIKNGTVLISGDELILETDTQTIYFKKSE